MEFAEACSEVDFILENLQPSDREKIPQSVFEFFKNNKSLFYKVNLTTDKSLAEQDLKNETKAFLQIINYKYFSNKEQQEKFRDMLENDNTYEKIENENNIKEVKNPQIENQLVIYKENKVLNFIKKILGFFRRKHTN